MFLRRRSFHISRTQVFEKELFLLSDFILPFEKEKLVGCYDNADSSSWGTLCSECLNSFSAHEKPPKDENSFRIVDTETIKNYSTAEPNSTQNIFFCWGGAEQGLIAARYLQLSMFLGHFLHLPREIHYIKLVESPYILMKHPLGQPFSTRVPLSPRVPPKVAKGSLSCRSLTSHLMAPT